MRSVEQTQVTLDPRRTSYPGPRVGCRIKVGRYPRGPVVRRVSALVPAHPRRPC